MTTCATAEEALAFVHRRLWPLLVRIAKRFAPEQIARVREEHTPSGRHVNRVVPFPEWVPDEVSAQADAVDEERALAVFGAWLPFAKR